VGEQQVPYLRRNECVKKDGVRDEGVDRREIIKIIIDTRFAYLVLGTGCFSYQSAYW
jgi:hypothetical protein